MVLAASPLQYYSTVDLVPHQYSGLVGVVAIGRMGTFAADGASVGEAIR